MPDNLEELKRLGAATTPGKRTYDAEGQIVWGPNGEHIADMRGVGANLPVDANGLFVAALDSETVLALIARVRKTQKLLGELYAIVKGENPSLLHEDEGRNGDMVLEIEELMEVEG